MTVTITLRSGRTFPLESRESLLDGANRAGIFLEHSCRTGRCGSCKVQVTQGETVEQLPESGLSHSDRAAGWVLSCARTAETDVRLAADDLGVKLPDVRISPAKIDTITPLGDDVIRVRLRLPPTAPLAYIPGQYVDIALPTGAKRSYSMATAPGAGQSAAALEFLIRLVPGGTFSTHWTQRAKPGDLLRVHGPHGTFFLRQPMTPRLLLLATGTGIAPIQALLEQLATLAQERLPERVDLLWGGRRPDDFFVDPNVIGRRLPTGTAFSLTRCLSGPAAGWQEGRGRLLQYLPLDADVLAATTVYACGAPAMIQDARSLLERAGLPAGRFHSDAFVSSS